jgi:hypothetical protein
MNAAITALTQLLSKGGSYEHQKLLDANIFIISLNLLEAPSRRQQGLTMLYNIIPHTAHTIVQRETDAEKLISLFE